MDDQRHPWLTRILWAMVGLSVVFPLGDILVARQATAAGGVTSGSVTVIGSGFGHGVGMSQYGAKGQALAGRSASQILTHYYTGTRVSSATDKVDIKVNVLSQARGVALYSSALASGGGQSKVSFSSGGYWNVYSGDNVVAALSSTTIKFTLTRANGSTYTATSPTATVTWAGTRQMAGTASTLTVGSTSVAGANPLNGKKRSYRWGKLDLSAQAINSTGTRIQGILTVDLHNEYLRGLAEVPSSWPSAALQAQAIAGRNYALQKYRLGVWSSCGGCHLWDDERSQAYSGWSKENEGSYGARWVAAVEATHTSSTAGQVVVDGNGSLITAYYSSSSGGRTRNSEDVWINALSYLRSVDDPWSVDVNVNPSYSRWSRAITVSKVMSVFGLSDLSTLSVTAKDAAGAAKTVTATASNGKSVSISGNSFRSKFGLPAAWLHEFVLPVGAGPAPSPTATPTATPTPSKTLDGQLRKAPAEAKPPQAMAANLAPHYFTSGSHDLGGTTMTTTCEPTAIGERCVAIMDVTVFALDAGGDWTESVQPRQDRVTYQAAVDTPFWATSQYASAGQWHADGTDRTTVCTAEEGPRTCTTTADITETARKPGVDGWTYYERTVPKVIVQVVLN